MKKPKTSKKKMAKKAKASASKTVAAKSKPAAKKKATAKNAPVAKAKLAPKKKARRVPATVLVGNQNVETVQTRPKTRVARAGAGGGDFGGVSIVEDVDSESAEGLLEEGQAFESGIVRGVEDAGAGIEQEVHTREVPQDDVPDEYEDKDRP